MNRILIASQRSRLFTIAFLLLAGTISSLAQTLKGKVVDSRTEEPIIGAVVSVKNDKGNSTGAVTDIDGNFELKVKSFPTTLVASYTGYNKEEVDVYEVTDDVIQINLTEDFNGLNEVVVIGYGQQKKKDLSGSVATVNVSDITKTPAASFNSLLDGTTAGLQVTPTSGQPGAAVSLRVRGGSSVQGGNEPLYVIDGFPIYSSPISSGVANSSTIDPLSSINAGDIESITVLKDASATAIYGSRGANGVIIITTKRGKSGGKASISYNGSVGFQTLRKKVDVLDAHDFAILRNDALYAINPSLGKYQYKSLDEIDALGKGTDWQDEAYRTAFVQNHQLSISGGSEKTHYAISGNYLDQDGILVNTGFKRLGVRVNLDSKLTKHLTFGLNVSGNRTDSKNPFISSSSASAGNVVFSILQVPATVPVYSADGGYNYDSEFDTDYKNPVASLKQQTNKSRNYNLIGTTYGEYEFIKNLKLKVLFGTNINNRKDYSYIPSVLYEGRSSNGSASIATVDQSSWLNENTLTYAWSINKVHNFDVLVGFTQQEAKNEIVRTGSSNFTSDDLTYNSLQGGSVAATPYSYTDRNSLISYLGRVNYNFDERHFLSLSLRRDGSSRFGKNRKWGTFPSVGYSWNIAKEPFFKPYKKVFSNLKLRLSYGVTGNQEIGDYQSLSTLSNFQYVIVDKVVVGTAPDRIANDELGWETTHQFDAGLDFGFFKDRLNFTVDYYYKKTTDLLLSVAIPYTSGFGTSLQNYGSVSNQGLEFSVNSKNFVGKNFNWNTSFNISFNRNKVLELGGGASSYITTNLISSYIIEKGKPLGTFYGAVYDGVLQKGEETEKGQRTYNQTATPGDRLYKDLNGDGKFTNSEDRTDIGNAQPDFIFGLNNTLTYKNFDLSFFISGSVGNDILNLDRERLSLYTGQQNSIGLAKYHWTEENPNPIVSRAKLDPATVISTEFIEDGSYVRLKNITLGYTFPNRTVRAIGISALRVYFSASNLLTITSYSGYDPEVTSADNALTAGTDYGAYPSSKAFNFGVQVNF